ncbi:MAG: response regulator [Desulfococcaceae bacterium]
MNASEPLAGNILVIDDKPANLRLLTDMLAKRGHMVRPVPAGKLGLRAAHAERPDLILLDIKMPEMNGFQVCRSFKETPTLADIPIIFISAHAETEDKLRAFQMGAVDYISKPFQVEEVLARVEAHLTIRRLMEEKQNYQKSLEAEVERRTREAEAANERLRSVSQTVEMGTLVSGILHELRNALFPLSATSEMLMEDMDSLCRFYRENGWEAPPGDLSLRMERMATLTGRLEPYTRKLERFAETILAASRNVRMEPEPQPFDMRRYVEDLENLIRVWSKRGDVRKTIAIQTRIPDHAVMTFADPEHFFQIAANFCKNSVDAIQEKGTITIEARNNRDYPSEFYVADTGPGIPFEKIPKIFQPFFTTKAAGVGTGLGLSISRGLIEKNNGRLIIDIRPGRGARFGVWLPRRAPDAWAAGTVLPSADPR